MNPTFKDYRLYEPPNVVVNATRKVKQRSELAPSKGPPAKPLLTSVSQQQPGYHSQEPGRRKREEMTLLPCNNVFGFKFIKIIKHHQFDTECLRIDPRDVKIQNFPGEHAPRHP